MPLFYLIHTTKLIQSESLTVDSNVIFNKPLSIVTIPKKNFNSNATLLPFVRNTIKVNRILHSVEDDGEGSNFSRAAASTSGQFPRLINANSHLYIIHLLCAFQDQYNCYIVTPFYHANFAVLIDSVKITRDIFRYD